MESETGILDRNYRSIFLRFSDTLLKVLYDHGAPGRNTLRVAVGFLPVQEWYIVAAVVCPIICALKKRRGDVAKVTVLSTNQ